MGQVQAIVPPRRRASSMRRREMIDGYLFLSPWIIGFLLFVGGPMVASFFLSFTAYDIIGSPRWVGLDNFVHAFTRDRLFWPSLGRTFYYAAIVVPVGIVGSLMLASLLNQPIRGKAFFRTFFFLPHLTPIVASAVLWVWIFQPQVGLANYLLRQHRMGRSGVDHHGIVALGGRRPYDDLFGRSPGHSAGAL